MKNKNYLIKIVIFFILIVPINVLAYSKYIIPGGQTVGIEVYSKGILIVDFYEVNNKLIAKEKGFRVGDIITKINNTKVNNINDMLTQINNSKSNKINVTIERNNKELNIEYELPREDNIIKTGIFVKDKITGLGTLSFIDPETKSFGALGHEMFHWRY